MNVKVKGFVHFGILVYNVLAIIKLTYKKIVILNRNEKNWKLMETILN